MSAKNVYAYITFKKTEFNPLQHYNHQIFINVFIAIFYDHQNTL